MKSIERRFKNISQKNPYWSSCVSFAETCNSRCFKERTIQFWFNKLVDKNDYEKRDKKALLSHLLYCSKSVEERKK